MVASFSHCYGYRWYCGDPSDKIYDHTYIDYSCIGNVDLSINHSMVRFSSQILVRSDFPYGRRRNANRSIWL